MQVFKRKQIAKKESNIIMF